MDGQVFPKSTLESARKAKLTMENFYDNLLVQDRDRTNRWKKLDLSMEEMGLSNDEVRGHTVLMHSRLIYAIVLVVDLMRLRFSCTAYSIPVSVITI